MSERDERKTLCFVSTLKVPTPELYQTVFPKIIKMIKGSEQASKVYDYDPVGRRLFLKVHDTLEKRTVEASLNTLLKAESFRSMSVSGDSNAILAIPADVLFRTLKNAFQAAKAWPLPADFKMTTRVPLGYDSLDFSLSIGEEVVAKGGKGGGGGMVFTIWDKIFANNVTLKMDELLPAMQEEIAASKYPYAMTYNLTSEEKLTPAPKRGANKKKSSDKGGKGGNGGGKGVRA